MALKHKFTRPSSENVDAMVESLAEEVKNSIEDTDKTLKKLVREFVESFLDITEGFYEDLDQLEERIMAVEKKYNLDELEDDSRPEQEA